MIKNPQIRYQGQQAKGYIFPKYPGKFFVQNEKHSQHNSQQKNHHSKSKQSLHIKNQNQQQYKSLKAQADYIKKIHQIKKRLQTQIKKYNKEKKQPSAVDKKYSFNINDSHSLNLQEICVNIRRQQYNKFKQNPQIRYLTPTNKKLNRKNTVKFLLKNKAWIKRNLKTQEQSFLIKRKKSISHSLNQLNNSSVCSIKNIPFTKSLDQQNPNKLQIKDQCQHRLPSLDKFQTNNEQNINRAAIRYSIDFPKKSQIVHKNQQKKSFCLKPQKSSDSNRESVQNSNRTLVNKSNIKRLKILQLQGSSKNIQTRHESRRKYLLQRQQQRQSDIFLKGWQGQHEKFHPYNDSLGGQFY